MFRHGCLPGTPVMPLYPCSYHRSAGPRLALPPRGTYRRRCEPRVIQRYRCSRCRRSFSDQTFCTTYWLKRSNLLIPIFRSAGRVGWSGWRCYWYGATTSRERRKVYKVNYGKEMKTRPIRNCIRHPLTHAQ
jgi:hypothetical protein